MNSKIEEVSVETDADVAIIGVGFVGLTLAMALCDAGFKVLGVEKNPRLLDEILRGKTNILEPEIETKLQSYVKEGRFSAVNHLEKWQRRNEAMTIILTVGTPLKDGKVDNTSILESLGQISDNLRDDDLLILRSTVGVGTSRRIVGKYLAETGKHVHLAMCPERTVEGNALNEIKHLPQIVGAIDGKSAELAISFFEQICTKVVLLSSIESAEFLKLANNTYRDLMFAFSNELTLIAQKIGISSREVISAANYNYPRSQISLPGPSGGPCLEKDPWILVESAAQYEIDLPISRSSRIINETSTLSFVIDSLEDFSFSNVDKKVGLLGLSFKGSPEVRDSRGSFALTVANYFREADYNFVGFEPAGAVDLSTSGILVEHELENVLKVCEVLIISTNHPSFRVLHEKLAQSNSRKPILVVDMWGVVDDTELPNWVNYKRWG